MYSKVKILGHPVHPMLVAFPVAFYTSTLVSFIVYVATSDSFWFYVGTIANWAGVVTAAVAALPGFIDWAMGIPRGTPAKHTGLLHMMLNVTALALFVVSGVVQLGQWEELVPNVTTGILLSALGVGCTVCAGFLGWKLVQQHHVGVDLTPAQQRLEPIAEQPAERPPFEPTPLGR